MVQRVRELTARTLTRFGGHFAHSSGEAIQVYFGYPRAMEDAARRAVLAALEINSEIKALRERWKRSREMMIDFRIGIHTGIVVTEEVEAEVSSERHSVVGNVPRIAAGLAAIGQADEVVVSGTTRQIVGESFEYRSLGKHSSKAIGRNVDVFAVTASGITDPHRDKASLSGQETPLIGREHEMGLLSQCWQQAVSGAGQVVCICADAGVGKSRLLSAFRGEIESEQQQTFSNSLLNLSPKQRFLSDQRVSRSVGGTRCGCHR